jgi:autotransporter-associated beta strand protein
MDLTGGSATVDTRGGNISLSGILSGTGGLTTAGPGLLILSGDNTYGGGTAVDAGTLDVANSDALPDGTSLTVGAGGPFAPDFSAGAEPGKAAGGAASPGAAVAAVPEPGSLALLLAALSSAAACYPFSRRVREQG